MNRQILDRKRPACFLSILRNQAEDFVQDFEIFLSGEGKFDWEDLADGGLFELGQDRLRRRRRGYGDLYGGCWELVFLEALGFKYG